MKKPQLANLAIVIASKGRPQMISQWSDILKEQTTFPSKIVYSVTDDKDLPDIDELFTPSIVIKGPPGSCVQRNRGIEAVLDSCEIIVFFDDDYIPAKNCLENIQKFMMLHPDVAGATGNLLMDGINTKGIDFISAKRVLDEYYVKETNQSFDINRDLIGLYGCNMVYRSSAIKNVRFDEKLPLYAWQEDVDFAVRAGHHGRIVKTDCFAGIHQGIKNSRVSGKKFGYSQISNPIYLIKKGTMPLNYGIKLMLKNLISNHLKVFTPEKWVDRKGRVLGNWIAIKDLITNRLDPENVLTL